jgi:hypothetical protein
MESAAEGPMIGSARPLNERLLERLYWLRNLLHAMVCTGALTYAQAAEILDVDGEVSKLQKEVLYGRTSDHAA